MQDQKRSITSKSVVFTKIDEQLFILESFEIHLSYWSNPPFLDKSVKSSDPGCEPLLESVYRCGV